MDKEKMIDKILCYMHDEILKNGLKPSQARFDFIFCDEQSLIGGKTKSIKESEDLINIKNLTKLENEQIKSLIKECISYSYIKNTSCSEQFRYLQLTDEGMARAISVLKASPVKNVFYSVLAHPLFNTIVSAAISFIIGYKLGGK